MKTEYSLLCPLIVENCSRSSATRGSCFWAVINVTAVILLWQSVNLPPTLVLVSICGGRWEGGEGKEEGGTGRNENERENKKETRKRWGKVKRNLFRGRGVGGLLRWAASGAGSEKSGQRAEFLSRWDLRGAELRQWRVLHTRVRKCIFIRAKLRFSIRLSDIYLLFDLPC